MAIKGCSKLLIPATIRSFRGKRCYSAEVAMARLNEVALSDGGVGREGIEPSWVAPGDFKSPASTVSPPPHLGVVVP